MTTIRAPSISRTAVRSIRRCYGEATRVSIVALSLVGAHAAGGPRSARAIRSSVRMSSAETKAAPSISDLGSAGWNGAGKFESTLDTASMKAVFVFDSGDLKARWRFERCHQLRRPYWLGIGLGSNLSITAKARRTAAALVSVSPVLLRSGAGSSTVHLHPAGLAVITIL
jgi:hypothetical protein